MHKKFSVFVFSFFIFISFEAGRPILARHSQGPIDQTSKIETANRLKAEADEAFKKSRYQEAEAKYQEAMQIYERMNEKAAIADCLYKLGRVYKGMGKYDKAIEHLEKAVKLHEEIGDRKAMGSDLTEIADVEISKGKYRKSLETSEQALKIHEALGNKKGIADTLRNIGKANKFTGKYSNALEYSERSLKMAEELGDKRGVAASLANIGIVYRDLGNYTEALEYLEKSLRIGEEIGDKIVVARSFNHIGAMHWNLGNYTEALEYHQRSLKMAEEIGDKIGVASSLNNTAVVQQHLGNYTKALEYYQKSLKIKEETGDKIGAARSLNNIGTVQQYLGNYTEALGYYQKSLETWEEIRNKWGVAASVDNIGLAYRSLGNYTEALKHHKKALKIFEEIKDKWGVAASLGNIGIANTSLGNYTEALEYYQKSLKIWEEIGDKNEMAISLSNIGLIHYKRFAHGRIRRGEKELLDAERNLSEAIKISKEIGRQETFWSFLHRKGLVFKELGKTDQTIGLLKEAIEVIEKLRGQLQLAEEKASFFKEKLEVYESLIELLIKLQNYQEAFNYAQKTKARAFLDLLSEAKVDVRQGIDSDLLHRKREIEARLSFLQRKLQQAHSQAKKDDKQIEAWKGELDSKFSEYQQLQREIRQRHPKYADLHNPEPATVAQIQRLLDNQTVLMEYLTTSETPLLFVITREDFKVYQLSEGRKRLEQLVREQKEEEDGQNVKWWTAEKLKGLGIRQTLINPPPNASQPAHLRQPDYYMDHYLKRAYQLYEVLIKPAEALLKGKKRLIVAPDGVLAYLPFEILLKKPIKHREGARIDFSGLPYLIKDHVIYYAPSASILASLRKNPEQKEKPKKELLAYGDPIYPKTARAGHNINNNEEGHHGLRACDAKFRPLDHSREEVNRIAKLFPKNLISIYLGADANEENVKKEKLDEYRRIHFATHGCLNESKPQFSALVLSQVGGGPEDGFLQLFEIFNLKLNAELVVLSACVTGLGKEVRGEGLIGLTRGFIYAGTPSVVASLWNVADFTSAEFMEKFYRNMRGKVALAPATDSLRRDKAEALRDAKLEIIKSGIKGSKYFSHPFFWSAFVLIGDKE